MPVWSFRSSGQSRNLALHAQLPGISQTIEEPLEMLGSCNLTWGCRVAAMPYHLIMIGIPAVALPVVIALSLGGRLTV